MRSGISRDARQPDGCPGHAPYDVGALRRRDANPVPGCRRDSGGRVSTPASPTGRGMAFIARFPCRVCRLRRRSRLREPPTRQVLPTASRVRSRSGDRRAINPSMFSRARKKEPRVSGLNPSHRRVLCPNCRAAIARGAGPAGRYVPRTPCWRSHRGAMFPRSSSTVPLSEDSSIPT
ncbi:hypothetical protein EDC25_101274 [Pseudofulvimonas gallinarii]|uniref:Uncharacterized protein n=1 Tax=Pseudofulvimonas gallinarii TaxID=634155 RepID=A0A4R3LT05_9GAMM|nr:hypothetical protein EDC25_101274 [Pseudofulvimonas gallinarii]